MRVSAKACPSFTIRYATATEGRLSRSSHRATVPSLNSKNPVFCSCSWHGFESHHDDSCNHEPLGKRKLLGTGGVVRSTATKHRRNQNLLCTCVSDHLFLFFEASRRRGQRSRLAAAVLSGRSWHCTPCKGARRQRGLPRGCTRAWTAAADSMAYPSAANAGNVNGFHS